MINRYEKSAAGVLRKIAACSIAAVLSVAPFPHAQAQTRIPDDPLPVRSPLVLMTFDRSTAGQPRFFVFHLLEGPRTGDRVEWFINGVRVENHAPRFEWPIVGGEHVVKALIWRADNMIAATPPLRFIVR